ncbi:MAG: alpha/beta hydrolase [Gammaproteobacteria bacterium]
MKSYARTWSALCTAVLLNTAAAQGENFQFYSELAREWYDEGQYFEWTSTTANNNGARVNVFYKTFGDPRDPQLLLVHGFPNSSFDFNVLVPLLQDDYYIATLDFPGSGFSDKPLDGFSYMLEDNARLLDFFIREIVELENFALYTHDRGVSIGLAFLGHYLDNPDPAYEINYHFLSNSGMFLPLANLAPFQLTFLDLQDGPEQVARMRAAPRQTTGDPVSLAYADMRAFNDGNGALLHVGRYLLEREANEYRWLDHLPRSPVPVAYLWGLLDTVNPPRIANYVWANYLNSREAESSFWILPSAGHYPQRDEPEAVAKIVRMALNGEMPDRQSEEEFMRRYAAERAANDGVYMGHSIVEPLNFPSEIEYTPDGYVEQPN